ncbi:hypothetical protein ACLM5H_21340 [Fredinandcohnia humi]
MKKVLIVLLISIVLVIGFVTIRFGSALTQEGNPVPIFSAISKLTFGNTEFVEFSVAENEHRYVSKNNNESRYMVVEDYMKERGWDFYEQMGSGLVFKKADKTTVIETRLFTGRYFLWDVPSEIVD